MWGVPGRLHELVLLAPHFLSSPFSSFSPSVWTWGALSLWATPTHDTPHTPVAAPLRGCCYI